MNEKELDFLKALEHQNIVKGLGIFERAEFGIGLVMEYCEYRNCTQLFGHINTINSEVLQPNKIYQLKLRIIFEVCELNMLDSKWYISKRIFETDR